MLSPIRHYQCLPCFCLHRPAVGLLPPQAENYLHCSYPGNPVAQFMSIHYCNHSSGKNPNAIDPMEFSHGLSGSQPTFIAQALSLLYHKTITQSIVPCQWKGALTTPNLKLPQPTKPADFRPICPLTTLHGC